MIPWLLLLLTLGSAYLTYDAYRWTNVSERMPLSVIASLWKGELSHMNLVERDEVRRNSARYGMSQICWLFLAVTISLAIATVRAFRLL